MGVDHIYLLNIHYFKVSMEEWKSSPQDKFNAHFDSTKLAKHGFILISEFQKYMYLPPVPFVEKA